MPQVAPVIRAISTVGSLSRLRCKPIARLELTSKWFERLWSAVIVGHFVGGAAMYIFMQFYLLLGRPEMSYYSLMINPSLSPLQLYAIPFGVGAAAHAYAVVGACVRSIQMRELTFASWNWPRLLLDAHYTMHHRAPTRQQTRRHDGWQRHHCFARSAQCIWLVVKLVFSVNSPYFNVFHVIREFIEIATQVVQAYWYSIYMSYSSINHMLVAVIALNCWSTPAIYRLMKMHEAQNDRERLLSRVLCLLANAILNGFSSIVLPMALLVPLWKDFNFETFDVPTAYTYIDVYFAREVKGLQIIGTGTFGGLLVKLVPHVSILTCLFMVVHTVGRAPIERVSSSRANAITPSRLTAADFATVVMQAQVRQTFSSVHLVIEAVFIATGIAVLAIHITTNGAASRFPFDPHCDLVIAPWFATKYPCFVYTYDCEYFNSTTAHEGDLAFLDETALSTLNFAHCDELVVPSDIRRFTSLIGMNFKYLTLVDWPREAAVVQQYFPNMVFIAFSHVNLTTIPVGVLGPLPDLLQDMEFTRTNLSVIPNDLYEHWPDVGTLFIEFSHVKEIPESLLRINLYDLSLIGNKIENASVLEGLPSGISRVSLDHNPLRVLPAELQASEAVIVDFSAEHTMLTDVPVALVSNIVHLYLQDTAICQNARSEWQALEQVVCDRSYFRSDGKCLLD